MDSSEGVNVPVSLKVFAWCYEQSGEHEQLNLVAWCSCY